MSLRDAPPFPRPGSSLDLAIQTAGARRPALLAWARWWHEVSRIPTSVSDAAIGEKKLAWWSQAVNDAFRQPPQHPLLVDLLGASSPAEREQAPPQALWQSQIQGLGTLLQQTRWLDQAGLRHHMDQTTGAALEGAAWVLGARSPQALSTARALGVALRRANLLSRVGQDAHAGWLHIPVDVLQQHDVRAHEWLRPAPDAPTDAMCGLMALWQSEVVEALTQALGAMRDLPAAERQALRPLRVLARLNLVLMADLEEHRYQVLRQRISVGPWRKWWTALTTR